MIKILILLNLALYVFSQESPDYVAENVCFCVTKGSCVDGKPSDNNNGNDNNGNNNSSNNDGTSRPTLEPSDGSLDERIFYFQTTSSTTVRTTTSSRRNVGDFLGTTTNAPITPASSGQKIVVFNQTSCAEGLELCCPTQGYFCGTRYPPVEEAPVPMEISQSEYGAYPWHTAILSTLTSEYIGAGALIDHRHVLTVAHKIYKSTFLTCRFGEWNAFSNMEPLAPLEVEVDPNAIFIHPEFKSLRTLHNDIAILRLEAPGVQLGVYPTVTNICLPSQPILNMRCWVSGWGQWNFQDSSYQAFLKQVNLPLVEHFSCQDMLRKTRLGDGFLLNALSFICAGGEENKDACIGDGGSALACEFDGHFYLAGLVAWGIGCGTLNVPGAYVNIYNYIPWIQSVVHQSLDGSHDISPKSTRSTLGASTLVSTSTPRLSNNTFTVRSVVNTTSSVPRLSNYTIVVTSTTKQSNASTSSVFGSSSTSSRSLNNSTSTRSLTSSTTTKSKAPVTVRSGGKTTTTKPTVITLLKSREDEENNFNSTN